MNILLTNDDGVDSPGIMTLFETLKACPGHNVFVLAPDSDRSGVSNGLLALTKPLKITEKQSNVWSCEGLPADCVLAAGLGGRPCKPDVVISGINRGGNLGTDIIYSGTCAAARQASLLGIPGIALSLAGCAHWDGALKGGSAAFEKNNWGMAAAYAVGHLEEYLDLWKRDIFINVNIPNNSEGPVSSVRTLPVLKNYNDSAAFIKGPLGTDWFYLVSGDMSVHEEAGTDWEAVSRNQVSISLICVHPLDGKQRL
jgi:5'-nucleotidase